MNKQVKYYDKENDGCDYPIINTNYSPSNVVNNNTVYNNYTSVGMICPRCHNNSVTTKKKRKCPYIALATCGLSLLGKRKYRAKCYICGYQWVIK